MEDNKEESLLERKYEIAKELYDGCNELVIEYAQNAFEESKDCRFSNILGDVYYSGKIVEKDYKKAYEYYSKALESGAKARLYKLGMMYYNGWYVEQDYNKAYNLFIEKVKSAGIYDKLFDENDKEMYNKASITMLAKCYQKGYGVEKDLKVAGILYSKVKNNPRSLYVGANIYYNGNVPDADFDDIVEKYQRVIEYFDFRNWNEIRDELKKYFYKAYYKLGCLYLREECRDVDKAYHYITIAKGLDDPKINEYYETLKSIVDETVTLEAVDVKMYKVLNLVRMDEREFEQVENSGRTEAWLELAKEYTIKDPGADFHKAMYGIFKYLTYNMDPNTPAYFIGFLDRRATSTYRVLYNMLNNSDYPKQDNIKKVERFGRDLSFLALYELKTKLEPILKTPIEEYTNGRISKELWDRVDEVNNNIVLLIQAAYEGSTVALCRLAEKVHHPFIKTLIHHWVFYLCKQNYNDDLLTKYNISKDKDNGIYYDEEYAIRLAHTMMVSGYIVGMVEVAKESVSNVEHVAYKIPDETAVEIAQIGRECNLKNAFGIEERIEKNKPLGKKLKKMHIDNGITQKPIKTKQIDICVSDAYLEVDRIKYRY